jgi:hypothetical protein
MFLFMPGEPSGDVLGRAIRLSLQTSIVAAGAFVLLRIEALLWASAGWPGVILGSLLFPITVAAAPVYDGLTNGTWNLLASYGLLALLWWVRSRGRSFLATRQPS